MQSIKCRDSSLPCENLIRLASLRRRASVSHTKLIVALIRENLIRAGSHSRDQHGQQLSIKMVLAAHFANLAPQRSHAAVNPRPHGISKSARQVKRPASISEKAQERLQSSLAALDALLLPDIKAKPAGMFPKA